MSIILVKHDEMDLVTSQLYFRTHIADGEGTTPRFNTTTFGHYNVYAVRDMVIVPGEWATIPTDLYWKGSHGFPYAVSMAGSKVHSGFVPGKISISWINHTKNALCLKKGEVMCQFIIDAVVTEQITMKY